MCAYLRGSSAIADFRAGGDEGRWCKPEPNQMVWGKSDGSKLVHNTGKRDMRSRTCVSRGYEFWDE